MGGEEGRSGEKGGVRIFGVTMGGGGVAEAAEGRVGCPDVGAEVMKKSKSMGDLPSAVAAGVASDKGALERGYVSDEGLRTHKTGRRRRKAEAGAQERKKGTPWSKEEHRTFLEGLDKLGKGDWRGISRNFVLTRTPTQVASHAQKYFIRQNIPSSRKRRSSLFDVAIHDPASTSKTLAIASEDETQKGCVDMTLQSCKNIKVGAAEVNFKATVPPGVEGPSYSCFETNGPDPYEPKSFQGKEGVSELMEEKLMLVAPTVIDASQFVDSHKMHVNPPTDSLEFNLLPCHPALANTLHQVAGSSDLNLSIGPPKLYSLNEAPTCDGIGAIRVV